MKNLRAASLGRKYGDSLFSWALVSPTMLLTFLFILVPVIDSIIKSFTSYEIRNVISGEPGTWNNFENYINLFANAKLVPAIVTTFTFMICVVVLQFTIGMSLATLLNAKIKGSRFLRSIMMIPWVVPTVISALIWRWIYQPQYGLLKYIASLFGFDEFAILNDPDTALIGVIIAVLWKQIPLTALLLLAGLQNVPGEILEAATVDGASKSRTFFSIVIPSMKSVIKIVVSMSIIENFKQFPLIWNLTGGGPNNSTTTLAVLSYREAFVSNDLGSGAAVTTVWMLLMIIVIFFYNKFMAIGED